MDQAIAQLRQTGGLGMAAWVRVVDFGDRVIVLNLRKGRFTSIVGEAAAALQKVSRGDGGEVYGNSVAATAAIDRMKLDGILIEGGRLRADVGLALPRENWKRSENPGRRNLRDLVGAAWSLLTARRQMRRGMEKLRARLLDGRPPAPRDAVVDKAESIARVRVATEQMTRWLPGHVQCLQRSAAIVLQLQSRGIEGQLVIACAPLPFRAHAWVEVDGRSASDAVANLVGLTVIDRW